MKRNKNEILHLIGGMLVVVGSVLHILENEYAKYLFSVGVGALVVMQLFVLMDKKTIATKSLQERRTERTLFLVTLSLCVAVYFMFRDQNSWLIFVLIYALTTLYLSFKR